MSSGPEGRDPADELARVMDRKLSPEDRLELGGLRERFTFGRGVFPEFAAAVTFDGARGLLVATKSSLQFADLGGSGEPLWLPMSNVSSVWAASTGEGVRLSRRNGQSHVLTDVGAGASANEVALTLRGLAERARASSPGSGPAGGASPAKGSAVAGPSASKALLVGIAGLVGAAVVLAGISYGVNQLLHRPSHGEGDCVVLVEATGLSYGTDIEGVDCTPAGVTPSGAAIYTVVDRLNGDGRSCAADSDAPFTVELSHEDDDTTYCLSG